MLGGHRGDLQDSDMDGYLSDVDCDDNDADVYPGAPETCDGEVDEDYTPTPTSCDQGVCSAAGELACINGAIQYTCTPGTPDPEVCDGLDNDCSGEVDEGGLYGIRIGIPLELQFGLSGAALMVVFLMVFSYGRRRVATP